MREAIKGEIKSLLSNKDNPVCVLLKGDWGIGKTHLWKEIEKELKEKNNEKTLIAYVSLFGKENIAQIEQEVKTQIYTILKIKEKFKNMDININISGIAINGISISGFLSIFDKEIKKVIICFDDFERHSKNIEFRDILGEISVLKENNNCNILMIMNENELEKSDKSKEEEKNKKLDGDIFDEYKEKIVDFEFTYDPTPQDSFEAIKDNFGDFKDIASEYFNPLFGAKTNNIRTIKKIANAVNHISQHITNFSKLEYEIRKDFFNTIGDIITDYAEKPKQVRDSNLQAILNRFKVEKAIHSLYFLNSFNTFIKFYIENNALIAFANLDNEIQLAKKRYGTIQNNNQLKEFQNNFNKFYRKFTMLYDYDFKKSNEEYAKEILEFLNNDNFTKAVTDYSIARFLIKKLDELNDDKESNHNLGLKLMKEYIKIYKFDKESLDDIIDFDKDKLQPFYENFMQKNIEISDELNLNSSEKIIEYLSFNNYDNWGNLKFIKNEKLKEYFLNDAVFAEKCIKLSQNHEYKNLNEFKSKIIEVLEDIANDKKTDKFIQDKINNILNEIKKHNKS